MPSHEQVPSIVFIYPFEEGISAINNLFHGRELASSISKIITIIASITIAICLPQIPQVSIYLIGFISASIGVTGVAALSLGTFALGVILTAVNIAMVKKFFDLYYQNKYGHPNPEYRLTDRDKRIYAKMYPELSPEELDKLLKSVEKKIKHLVLNIERNNEQGRKDTVYALKHVLFKLKCGDLETYNNYYEQENYKYNMHISHIKRALNNLGQEVPAEIRGIENDLSNQKDFHIDNRDSIDVYMERELGIIRNSTWQTEGLVNDANTPLLLPFDYYYPAVDPVKSAKRILRVWETKQHSYDKYNDPEEISAILKDELAHQVKMQSELQKCNL